MAVIRNPGITSLILVGFVHVWYKTTNTSSTPGQFAVISEGDTTNLDLEAYNCLSLAGVNSHHTEFVTLMILLVETSADNARP